MSRRLTQALAAEPVTDVFLISHGWKGDLPAAKDQYTRWIACMAQCGDDIAQFRELRPGFRLLLVGLHWPSLPWGDEEFDSMAVSFVVPAAFSLEELVDKYARRLRSSPAARAALATIFEGAQQDIAPEHLPPQVRDAYLVLDREASLETKGVGGHRVPIGSRSIQSAFIRMLSTNRPVLAKSIWAACSPRCGNCLSGR